MMAYLLVIFWLGGASVTVIEPPRGCWDCNKSALTKCVSMANSVRKHFDKGEIIKIKCVPERMPK